MPSRIMLEAPMTERDPNHVLATATDRFERRLSEEIGALRVEITNQGAALQSENAATRLELSERFGALRAENAATRLELSGEIGKLRIDMTEQFAESRLHTEARHRELLKWALVFWVGQAAAVAGIVTAFS